MHILADNSSNLPALQYDREEFQSQTDDNLSERSKSETARREHRTVFAPMNWIKIL